MEKEQTDRQWMTIEVSGKEFSHRLTQMDSQATPGALLSRLALVHKVAIAYATEALTASGHSQMVVDIDELTDPPLYGDASDNDPVIIRFSYYPRFM